MNFTNLARAGKLVLAITLGIFTARATVCAEPQRHFAAPMLRLPYHLRDGFILINGRVDGKSGVFMLDTGMPFRVLLNRHYVDLGIGTDLKRGKVASGQALVIQSHRGSHVLTLQGGASLSAASGATFADPGMVLSGDFGFIETAVDARFLGFLGWRFLKNYDFVIDYDQQTIPLYPLRSKIHPIELIVDKASHVPVIRFTPSSPIVPFRLNVGGVALPAILDTGGHERISATREVFAKLTATHELTIAHRSADECVTIARARYRGYDLSLPDLQQVVGTRTLVTLGYPFLRSYRTIWRPYEGTVTLERKRSEKHLTASTCD